MTLATPDLVVVGHVCRDVVAGPPGWRPGGSVFYAASTAARLGYSVGVVTAGAGEVESLHELPNTVVVSLNAKRSTSFENVYEPAGRRQYLRALAPTIPPELVPPEWRKTLVALLAPVAGEVPPGMARIFPRALLGVSPQGWLRRLVVGEEVCYQAWDRALDVLPHAAAAIFSEEDVAGHSVSWMGFRGAVLVMTCGELGCELTHAGKTRHVPGFPSDETDSTGAGDVFAAAFMLKLQETREPIEAARFANCVASFSVRASGRESLPSAGQVQARLAQAAPLPLPCERLSESNR
ncbi:MAG TPA: PfkB family carbohydrate kinase [Chloroflexota bacterium]|nr:PfkB family carbohydrate kinase [Chloroflexota bacterium]